MLRSPLAGALVEAKGGSPWKDQAKTEGKDHPEGIGALFGRSFRIWEDEWNGATKNRLVRVCSIQAAWDDASCRTIRRCMENGGADVVSPTAYIGPSDKSYEHWAAKGGILTAEQVLTDLHSGFESSYRNNTAAKIVRMRPALG